MLIKEFEKKMQEIFQERPGTDPETRHKQADALMCETIKHLGYKKGVAIFEQSTKWYS